MAVVFVDVVPPAKPAAKASITAVTNKNVTVTATFSSDSKVKQYSLDNKTWKNYTTGITMTANGTVYFRAADAAGNYSQVTSYKVSNIDKTAPAKPTAKASITTNTPVKKLIEMVPYLFTVIVLLIISISGSKLAQPPASLGVNYFREER